MSYTLDDVTSPMEDVFPSKRDAYIATQFDDDTRGLEDIVSPED